MIYIYNKDKNKPLKVLAGPFPSHFDCIVYADINEIDINSTEHKKIYVGRLKEVDRILPIL